MSGPAAPDPQRFYGETLPAQFNRSLEEQERRGAAGRRLTDELKAVNATIRVDVRGEGGGAFFLNIEQGRMTPGDVPSHPPFLTVVQDRAAFESITREASDSAVALLGGLSGIGGELRLTRSRLENLGSLRGLVRFEVRGADGFSLLTHFGGGSIPAQPDTTITVDAEAYRRLKAGELDAQTAFLDQQIEVQGNVQLAMQLALAAVTPD